MLWREYIINSFPYADLRIIYWMQSINNWLELPHYHCCYAVGEARQLQKGTDDVIALKQLIQRRTKFSLKMRSAFIHGVNRFNFPAIMHEKRVSWYLEIIVENIPQNKHYRRHWKGTNIRDKTRMYYIIQLFSRIKQQLNVVCYNVRDSRAKEYCTPRDKPVVKYQFFENDQATI